jgi:hypothetical protein
MVSPEAVTGHLATADYHSRFILQGYCNSNPALHVPFFASRVVVRNDGPGSISARMMAPSAFTAAAAPRPATIPPDHRVIRVPDHGLARRWYAVC